jgi:hypothetical protein
MVTGQMNTGHNPGYVHKQQPSVTAKDKVEHWFIDPITKMTGHDGFICLMLLFPILETIIRFELEIPEDKDAAFSHGSKELHWFAEFMTIEEGSAQAVWDAFRNGLLHRSMIKGSLRYSLTGATSGRPANNGKDGEVIIYVWEFRDRVMQKLKTHHKKLWKGQANPLPGIYIEGEGLNG